MKLYIKILVFFILPAALVLYVALMFNLKNSTEAASYEERRSIEEVLFMVLTTEQYLHTRATAIRKTWGSRALNIIFACNCTHFMKLRSILEQKQTVPRELSKYMSVIDLPILHVNVTEDYNMMGKKVIQILEHSYRLFAGKVDWYYMVDDDTFVFTQNLVKFIRTRNTSEPYMYGFKRIGNSSGDFVYGGSGILLTNTSMRLLVEEINRDGCKKHVHAYGDWTIGRCSKAIGLQIGNSSDEYGRPRFHAYTPYTHYYGPLPSKLWIEGTHNRKIGKECCSRESISFHYVNTTLMYQMHENNENFLQDLLL